MSNIGGAARGKIKAVTGTAAPSSASQEHFFGRPILADPAVPQPAAPEIRYVFKNTDIPHPVVGNTMVGIVVRSNDLEFWETCVAELEDPNETRKGIRKRTVAIGSPGIGKSTTALFRMRKSL